MLLGLAPPQAT